MLAHPHDPGCRLLEVNDLQRLPKDLTKYATHLREITVWAHDYLSRPHAELGRGGPVCPFVPTSLRSGLFYLAVQPGWHFNPLDVERRIELYRSWFSTLEPQSGPKAQFKTILILFPDVPAEDAPEIIDATQARLKASFVESGLMLGQFHQLPPKEGGLRNPDFRPLRSPVPLLAIRHMVPSDLPFLVGERRLLDSYLRFFGDSLPLAQQEQVAELMEAVS